MRRLSLFLALLSWLCTPVSANPIWYEVAANNRLFIGGDGQRYVDDLHTYMRCADRLTVVPEKCVQYRQRTGTAFVPNLRRGDEHDEYHVRYNKVEHDYLAGYALDGRRTVLLSVEPKWLTSQAVTARDCAWRVSNASGRAELGADRCRSSELYVELALSPAGEQMSFTGTIHLTLTTSAGETKEFAAAITVRDFLIVAMGDSYTSGEGNPERNRTPSTPAQWLDHRCHRSVFSYPSITAAALALADPRHSVTLIHVACSGASAMNGVLGKYSGALSKDNAEALWNGGWVWDRWRRNVPQAWKTYGTKHDYLPAQVEQVAQLLTGSSLRRKPDLLLLSLGVNDAGLMVLFKKLAMENCDAACVEELRRWRGAEALRCDAEGDGLKFTFACLQERLAAVRATIASKLAPRRVYLMEYLNPLYDNDGLRCMTKDDHRELLEGVLGTFGFFLGWFQLAELSAEEVRFADEEFFVPLKAVLANTAETAAWQLLRPQGDENRRGFCGKRSWYHKYQESKERQYLNPNSWTDSVGTMHPNTYGHYFTYVRVLSQLRRDQLLDGHNLSMMTADDFARAQTPEDKRFGFVWYIWNRDNEDVSSYYKFTQPN